MSSYKCEICGTNIIDTPQGYITGCKHYPLPKKDNNPLNKYQALLNMNKKESEKKKLENAFLLQIKAERLTLPTQQYRFDKTRKWTADFAWVDKKVMCEIQGGIWVQGRHTRGKGYINDCDKLNKGQILGWKVFWFTSEHIRKGEAIEIIKEVLKWNKVQDVNQSNV